jgi:hypothetical protein
MPELRGSSNTNPPRVPASFSDVDGCHLQAGHAVLRVHAMHVRRATNMAGSPYEAVRIKTTLVGGLLREMRAAAVAWLAAPLAGNALAAELLLLQLITRCV